MRLMSTNKQKTVRFFTHKKNYCFNYLRSQVDFTNKNPPRSFVQCFLIKINNLNVSSHLIIFQFHTYKKHIKRTQKEQKAMMLQTQRK